MSTVVIQAQLAGISIYMYIFNLFMEIFTEEYVCMFSCKVFFGNHHLAGIFN